MRSGLSRFTIWHLMFAVTFFAISLAVGISTEIGFQLPFWALLWIAVCHFCSRMAMRHYVNIVGIGIAVSWGLSLALGLAYSHASFSNQNTLCKNKMLQIVAALSRYELENEYENGHCLTGLNHSWRVELLPILGRHDLYNQYDFSKPWDSHENLKLIPKIPSVYECFHAKDNVGQTCFKFITGEGTLFDGDATKFSRIADGTNNTIVLIEDVENPIAWTRPSDIDIDKAVKILTSQNKPIAHCNVDSVFYTEFSGPNLAYFDGSISEIGYFHSSSEARRLFGINDGVSEFGFGRGDESMIVYKSKTIYLVAIFAVMAVLAPLGFKQE